MNWKLDTREIKSLWKSHFIWKTYFEKDVKSVGTSKMEVSEGFQIYCREGAATWQIQKVVRQQRELKLNGISTGNSRMAKLLLAKLVRDLWKMEFKDMESTLGDMEVDVAMEVVLDQ